MNDIKILVVDDSCLYQRVLSDVINEHPRLNVVGVAGNGKIALEMVEALNPVLLTLDILMPEMDGIQTLIELRKRWPGIRTIMLSSLTSEGSDAALDALALGASEYSPKPRASDGVQSIRDSLKIDLIPKIEALCDIDEVSVTNETDKSKVSQSYTKGSSMAGMSGPLDLIAIGVSTGGPDALTKLFSQLPADLNVPVVIVQHMPPTFTTKLAARLDSASSLKVREAQVGDKLRAGTVYLAPGDYHMVLDKIGDDVIVNLNQNSPENSCRPSVDALFRSIPDIYGSRCLGVIMTGMGRDGFKGSEDLVDAGCSVIVQDKYSSVVWGMPKLVAMAGLAEEEVPLDKMASAILARARIEHTSLSAVQQGIGTVASNSDEYFQKNRAGYER